MIPCKIVHGDKTVEFSLNDDPAWFKEWQSGMVYEPEVINALFAFAKPGDLVVDAGANLGYHSIALSKLVGPTGKVLAFEPDPLTCAKLVENVVANRINNIDIRSTALWSHQEVRDFWVIEYCGYSSFLKYDKSKPLEVKTETLDANLDGLIPRIIKIDCEGAEGQILMGAEETLKKGVDCVIVEFNFAILRNIGVNEKDIRNYVCSLGYDFFILEKGSYPIFVPQAADISCPGDPTGKFFNGMFSTVEKVSKAWA